MRKPTIHLVIAALLVGLLALAPTATFARERTNEDAPDRTRVSESTQEVENESETEDSSSEFKDRVERKREEIKTKLETMKAERQEKLGEKRLEACQKRSEKINSIIQKRSEMATKQLEVFNTISERVQQFVSDKGYTINDYESLTTAISDKKAAAEAAIQANTAVVFSCDEADATDALKVPRESVNTVRDALKDYRTAIKDLIVQVKATADSEETSTETPEATKPDSTEAQ